MKPGSGCAPPHVEELRFAVLSHSVLSHALTLFWDSRPYLILFLPSPSVSSLCSVQFSARIAFFLIYLLPSFLHSLLSLLHSITVNFYCCFFLLFCWRSVHFLNFCVSLHPRPVTFYVSVFFYFVSTCCLSVCSCFNAVFHHQNTLFRLSVRPCVCVCVLAPGRRNWGIFIEQHTPNYFFTQSPRNGLGSVVFFSCALYSGNSLSRLPPWPPMMNRTAVNLPRL